MFTLLPLILACSTSPTTSDVRLPAADPLPPKSDLAAPPPAPEPAQEETAQVPLVTVENAKHEFATNFDILAQMAEAQKKPGYAQTFRLYAEWLRTEFVAVAIGDVDSTGKVQIINPSGSTLSQFILYYGSGSDVSSGYGAYIMGEGDEPNMIVLDTFVGQSTLGTAVLAHQLSKHRVLTRTPSQVQVPEGELEMFGYDASSHVLEVATQGAYPAFIANLAKGVKTPTGETGFHITPVPSSEFFALFPREGGGDRRWNWLFAQVHWDLNTLLDNRSTKPGSARGHRHQMLADRFAEARTTRAVEYSVASYSADQ